MNKKGERYQVLGFKEILLSLFFISSLIPHPSPLLYAQHTRLYACALASDEPSAFMGGSSMGAGLWQSDDTGRTWMQVGWKHVKCYSVDVVNSSDGKIIYQACGNGVLKSIDAGLTWRMLTDWRITEVLDIAVDQKAPKNIYIATPYAIWKSDDAGDNWYETDTDIPEPRFTSRIKIDPLDHLKIYAATESGLYESLDGGGVWKKKNDTKDTKELRDIEWDNKKKLHSVGKDLWSITRFDKSMIKGGEKGVVVREDEFLKNVHSLATIGNFLFAGSLNGGIWKYSRKTSIFEPSGLDKLQLWRLKTADIK